MSAKKADAVKADAVPLPEVLIFPERLLSANTAEKLLNRIYEIDHIRQVNVSGENLPAIAMNGPSRGQPIDHPERRTIVVNGEEIELRLLVGRIFVEIDDIDHLQKALEDIEKACKEVLPFGFNLEVGRYSKYRPTVIDYKKGKRC